MLSRPATVPLPFPKRDANSEAFGGCGWPIELEPDAAGHVVTTAMNRRVRDVVESHSGRAPPSAGCGFGGRFSGKYFQYYPLANLVFHVTRENDTQHLFSYIRQKGDDLLI
jgi:hypothetical protein